MNGALYPRRIDGDGAIDQTECAVVLIRTTETQFHLGLRRTIFPPEWLLHLAWHRWPRDEPLANALRGSTTPLPSAVIKLALDPAIDEVLQALAADVAKSHATRGPTGTIAYSFGDSAATFDTQTGHSSDPDAAFTCATFVLAMLRSVGIRLIDPSQWRKPTVEDLDWQRSIGQTLLEWIEKNIHGDLLQATRRVEQDYGTLRYRPADVAAAATFARTKWPLGAPDVEPRANALVAQLA